MNKTENTEISRKRSEFRDPAIETIELIEKKLIELVPIRKQAAEALSKLEKLHGPYFDIDKL